MSKRKKPQGTPAEPELKKDGTPRKPRSGNPLGYLNLPKNPETGRPLPGPDNLPKTPDGYMLPGPGPKCTYTEAIGDEIIERLAGGESLSSICRDEHMPPVSTVLGWVHNYRGEERLGEEWQGVSRFSDRYHKAREASADVLVEEAGEIADDGTHDIYTVYSKRGTPYDKVDRECVDRSKLRVGFRQWLAAKYSKRYAERQMVEVSGSVDLIARMEAGRQRALEAARTQVKAISAGPAVPEVLDGSTDQPNTEPE